MNFPTYFWPFGVEFNGSRGILKSAGKVSEFDKSGRSVGKEDVIARIECNGFAVKADGCLEVAILAGLI